MTHLRTDPALVARAQPDLLNLHIEYMRPCEVQDSTVKITPLKIGSTACLLQLQLLQQDQLRMLALATTTNFDRNLGPSASTVWALHPPPNTVPDFDLVEAHAPEPNWLPATLAGEVLTFTHRVLSLNPRQGFTVSGVCDAWNRFLGDERVDVTYLGLLADLIPSMSDTLTRSGLYDAHAFHANMMEWAKLHPGVPARLGNSVAAAMKSTTFNNTVTMDLRFARRLPEEGLRWVFTRTATKAMAEGRMVVEITMCDEKMDLVCEASQSILVLEAQRKFHRDKNRPSSSL